MTREERLALRLKTYKGEYKLDRWDVWYLVRVAGKSLNFVGRFDKTSSGNREFIKWVALYALRDLTIASPAIGAILKTLLTK